MGINKHAHIPHVNEDGSQPAHIVERLKQELELQAEQKARHEYRVEHAQDRLYVDDQWMDGDRDAKSKTSSMFMVGGRR